MPAATIFDVARAAGVSKTTASDALRGRGRVSEETRRAVLDAAEALSYSLNRSARSLRTATTGAVGLHIPQVLVRSEYYLSFLHGVVDEAAHRDHDVTLIVATDRVRPSAVPHVDGIVVIDPVAGDQGLDRLLATGLPVVSCERFPGGQQPAGVVWSDHAREMGALLDHLAARGARRPALLGSTTVSEWSTSIQRAYRVWCRERGAVPVLADAAYGASTEAVQAIVTRLLADAPDVDALVAAGDGVAAAAAPAITASGRTVGADFLLAGGIDNRANQVLDPPVTAIDARAEDAGTQCARLLLDILDGTAAPGTSRELPLVLRERASTRGRPRTG